MGRIVVREGYAKRKPPALVLEGEFDEIKEELYKYILSKVLGKPEDYCYVVRLENCRGLLAQKVLNMLKERGLKFHVSRRKFLVVRVRGIPLKENQLSAGV